MKVKVFTKINPPPSSPIEKRPFIDYIDTAAVTEGRIYEIQHLVESFPSRAQREVHAKDILISSVRPNLRHNFFVTQDEDGMIASSGFVHIRVKESGKVDPRFLYYFLTCPANIRYYTRIADCSQSAYPSFNKDVIEDIEFPSILKPDQLLIAGILGSLDEKIEINRRKIAELEALAKTIYDYWFVQFDFPDTNGRPYKSSGGEMVWSKEAKRYLPKAWLPYSISQCGMFSHGVTYSKNEELPAFTKNAMPVYRGNNIANGFVVCDSNEVFIPASMVSSSQILKRGNLLIAMSSGSKEHVGKAGLITYNAPERAFGAFCTSFEPFPQFRYIIYNFFWSKSYRAYIQQICTGTGINNLKPVHFDANLLTIPQNEQIIDSFNREQKPIFDRIMDLDEESMELSKLRDSILPLLMNGQVIVAG